MKRYTMSFAAAGTHTPEHPERTAIHQGTGMDFDVTFQVWPSRAARDKSIDMQARRAPRSGDWRACKELKTCRVCRQEFVTTRQTDTCSDSCWRAAAKAQTESGTFECARCGETFSDSNPCVNSYATYPDGSTDDGECRNYASERQGMQRFTDGGIEVNS